MIAELRVVSDNESVHTLTVPPTIDDLRGVADAFLSTGWTLAAAVWAWTLEPKPGRQPKGAETHLYTLKGLAREGIRGLTDWRTVARYRAIWQSAIDAGLATSVEPGDVVEVPDAPFGLISDEPEPQDTPKTLSQNAADESDGEGWDDDLDDDVDDVPMVGRAPIKEMMSLSNQIIKAMARIHTLATTNGLTGDAEITYESIIDSSHSYIKAMQ